MYVQDRALGARIGRVRALVLRGSLSVGLLPPEPPETKREMMMMMPAAALKMMMLHDQRVRKVDGMSFT